MAEVAAETEVLAVGNYISDTKPSLISREGLKSDFAYYAVFQYRCLEYVLFSGVILAPPRYGFTNRLAT
jgi:hypothetical protein